MPRTPKRPKPIHLGSEPRYTLRPTGTPNAAGWRWQLEWYTKRDDASGRSSKMHTSPVGRYEVPADAEKAAYALLATGKVGTPVIPAGRFKTLGVLLRAFDAAVKADAERPRSTKAAYGSHLTRLIHYLHDLPVPPTHDSLERYRKARLGEGFAPSTIRQDFVILCAAWTWGRDRKRVPDERLLVPAVEVPHTESYTPPEEDVLRVLDRLELLAVQRKVPGWAPLAVQLTWATGARRTEVASIAPADVRVFLERDDAPFAEIVFGRHEGAEKTDERRVPLGDRETAEALAAWMEDVPADALTIWRRAPRTVEEVYEYLHRACDAEGVPHFTSQPIRRAVSDALFENGADPKVEAMLLGHSDATALKHYHQPRASALAAAMARSGVGRRTRKDGKVVPIERGRPK